MEENLVESFLSFIKMRSISYRGISKKNYYEFLGELILRFNNRDDNFFEILLNSLRILKVAETPPSQENLQISKKNYD
jgi:hypothetical protein